MKMDAIFDSTKKYRYLLTREWNTNLPRLLYIMLNPSTADHETDDQTLKQCIFFAKKFEYGSLEVVNLFALISTDPEYIREHSDPIGINNDKYILEAATRANTIVVAWGEKHFINQRHNKVAKMLMNRGHDLYCLGIAKSGHPRHPSRMSHSIESLQLYSTDEYKKKLKTYERIVQIIPTVINRTITSKEGYDPLTGSDYDFHRDVMED